jgi:hypothetical protein
MLPCVEEPELAHDEERHSRHLRLLYVTAFAGLAISLLGLTQEDISTQVAVFIVGLTVFNGAFTRIYALQGQSSSRRLHERLDRIIKLQEEQLIELRTLRLEGSRPRLPLTKKTSAGPHDTTTADAPERIP